MKETKLSKKLLFSFTLVIASFFILLTATLAWFTLVANQLGLVTVPISDPQFSTLIYLGVDEDLDNVIDQENGFDVYELIGAENYIITNWMPGQTKYFKIVVINEGVTPITVSISADGINDANSNENLLADVLMIYSQHPTIPSRVIDNQSISDLMSETPPANSFYLATDIYIPIGNTVTLYFSISFPSSSGNDYQDISLIIDKFSVAGM
jgi:hypothetical protein